MDFRSDSCRICLQEGFKNIFEEQDNVPICKKIVYCASVQVSQDDLLPKLICDQCMFYLDIAYTFKKECESTDNRLRNLLCKQQLNDDQEFISSLKYADEVNGIAKKGLINEQVQSKAVVVQFSDIDPASNSETKLNISQIIIENSNCISESFKHGKSKVGRHIAKKITGKLPQRLHQCKTGVNDIQKIANFNKYEEERVVEFEENSEQNLPMVGLEEIVVTTDHYLREVDTPCIEENQENNADIFPESQTSNSSVMIKKKQVKNKKIKVKLKMTLRKGNRRVNVFKDYLKNVQQKKAVTEGAESIERSVVTKIFKKSKQGFQCDVCNKSFPFRSHLKRHLNKHTGVKLYSCELCNQRFVNNYNLNVHMSKHTGEFPLKCEICNRGFPNPSLLKRHMISHTGEKQFQCRYCSTTFRQSSSLRLHEKMHINRPSYHCDICFKLFSYTNSLTAHKKSHFGRQRFSCDICLSTFSRKSSLVRHMGEHSKTKKITCKFCDLSFQTKSAYSGHLKTHCKYKCMLCGKSFKYKSNFNEHVKIHTR